MQRKIHNLPLLYPWFPFVYPIQQYRDKHQKEMEKK